MKTPTEVNSSDGGSISGTGRVGIGNDLCTDDDGVRTRKRMKALPVQHALFTDSSDANHNPAIVSDGPPRRRARRAVTDGDTNSDTTASANGDSNKEQQGNQCRKSVRVRRGDGSDGSRSSPDLDSDKQQGTRELQGNHIRESVRDVRSVRARRRDGSGITHSHTNMPWSKQMSAHDSSDPIPIGNRPRWLNRKRPMLVIDKSPPGPVDKSPDSRGAGPAARWNLDENPIDVVNDPDSKSSVDVDTDSPRFYPQDKRLTT